MPNQAEIFKLTLDETGTFKPVPNVPVHAFESLMLENGLVRMKITKDFAPYTPNPELGWTVAGFPPAQAKVVYDLAAGYPVDEDLEPVALEGAIMEAPPPVDTAVDIPEDWDKGHHLPRIRLAKAIAGIEQSASLSDVDARAIIQAELDRRHAHAA